MNNTYDRLANLNISLDLAIKRDKKNKYGIKTKAETKISVSDTKIDIKEIAKARKELGLNDLSLKIRQCLLCFDNFNSQGVHNRMCKDCSKL